MSIITLPKRLDERSMPKLLNDLAVEAERLRKEAHKNTENQTHLLTRWLKRRSSVISFAVVEPIFSKDFTDQLVGLVGIGNYIRFRHYRNAYLYLIPISTHTHLVKMMAGVRHFKPISNRALLTHRKVIMLTANRPVHTPLPWENPDSFDLECIRRLAGLGLGD